MGYADQQLSPFPGSSSGEVNGPVFGHNIVALAAWVSDDLPVKMGDNAGRDSSLFICKCRGHADKCFSSMCHGSAGEIVKLSAGPADVAQAGALRIDLPIQIHRDAVIYGDHIVLSGDRLGSIHILQRFNDHTGVTVHPVIEFSGSENDSRNALSGPEGLITIS